MNVCLFLSLIPPYLYASYPRRCSRRTETNLHGPFSLTADFTCQPRCQAPELFPSTYCRPSYQHPSLLRDVHAALLAHGLDSSTEIMFAIHLSPCHCDVTTKTRISRGTSSPVPHHEDSSETNARSTSWSRTRSAIAAQTLCLSLFLRATFGLCSNSVSARLPSTANLGLSTGGILAEHRQAWHEGLHVTPLPPRAMVWTARKEKCQMDVGVRCGSTKGWKHAFHPLGDWRSI